MNAKKRNLAPYMTILLAAGMQLPVAAYGSEDLLQKEVPSLGQLAQNPTLESQSTPTETQVPLLNGSIHKSERTLDGNASSESSTLNGQASDRASNLQAEKGSADSPKPYELVLKKLAAREKLTKEDFRSLNIGIEGFECDRTYYKHEAKVTAVYPGCPAAEAGLRVGDTIIVKNVDDSGVKDPTVPIWVFSCGIAGQPDDITVKRHGQTEDLHIVKMNMEDVPDLKLRRQYEQLVQQTGGPADNVEINPPFSATGLLKKLINIGI